MTQPTAAWPLFDLFLDLPHPAASPKCPPPFVINPPDDRSDVVIKEMGNKESIARIARFAFPEFNDRAPKPPAPPAQGGAGLNRFDVYWIQHKGFSGHTFSLQLSDGTRVHGHVRRYLPVHLEAKTRWDVGRRGVRAMVLLTRAAGGDQLFWSILKSVESISSQQAATPQDTHPSAHPQQAFLRALHKNHVAICAAYIQKPDDKRAPMVLTLQGAEFGNEPKFLEVDASRFLLPTSLMKPGESIVSACTVAPILPLFRCLGVPNSLRLLSALLSERRVLLISASPTRLTNCARSALSMLAQGMLHWQHLFIPVLPPHLMQYLAAPIPYLIGILTNMGNEINQVQEIGEVLIINLDNNQMETRGMQAGQVPQKIPDLCARSSMEDANSYNMQPSPAEELARDLTEILKSDKRTLSGDSAFQEGTKEAVKKVGKAFNKFKEKGRAYLAKQSNSNVSDIPEAKTPPPEENYEVNHQDADFVYTESCQNEAAEEEARISFTCFFLCMFGDMRWFLSQAQQGQPPALDRNKFIQSRRAQGDVEGTPMFFLVTNFVQTQMFEQFAKQRVEEIASRAPVPRDAPLFVRCANQHRASRIDFTSIDVRRVARELAQTSPSRFLVQSNATARRLAMSLTSNTAYQGDYQEALTRLTESCREASSVLFDVMSVVWLRIRDCKGMQWKHALYALHILRNLILHGPLAAVAEATDGMDKIRLLKNHTDNLRPKQAQQVRDAAAQVYSLLCDRAMLYWARRVCANSRRLIKHPPPGRLTRDARLRPGIPFKNAHAAMAPTGHRPSAALQAPAAPVERRPQPGRPQYQPGAAPNPGRQPAAAPNPVVDLLGMSPSGEPGHTIAEVEKQSNDVLGMFDAMAVSSSAPSDPFAGAPPSFAKAPAAAQSAFAPQPTYAQLPPKSAVNGAPKSPVPPSQPAFAQAPRSPVPPSSAPSFLQPVKSPVPPTSQPASKSPVPSAGRPAYTQQPGTAPAFSQQPMPGTAASAQPPLFALPRGGAPPAPAYAQIPPQQAAPGARPAPAQPAPTSAQIPNSTQPPQVAPAPEAYNPQQGTRSPPRPAQHPPAYNPQQGPQGHYNPQAGTYPPPTAAHVRPAQTQYPAQMQHQQRPPQGYPQGAQRPQQPGAPQQPYPGQQPQRPAGNLFVAPPPQAQAPAPPPARSNVNQFDPMRRDPFA